MLILTRQVGGALVIPVEDGEVEIRVLQTRGRQVRIGINAPKSVEVHREEIWEKIKGEKLKSEE